jgi:DNA mismatch repair protein MutS
MFSFISNANLQTDPSANSFPKAIPLSKIESVNDHFKLPISFIKNCELKENISADLELIKTVDPSSTPIYHYAFQPTTKCGEKVLEQMAKFYTVDVDFLKETQELLKVYKEQDIDNAGSDLDDVVKTPLDEMILLWDEIKNETGFKEKYYYIDWVYWEYLNKSDIFLQMMSMYNMAAPVVSLFIPVLILIIPFFMIKARGLDITINEYIEVLKVIAANHALGKLFTQFNSVSTEQKMYLVLSAAFYLFSIYQNILICIRFHENMNKIYKSLKRVETYIEDTLEKADYFLSVTGTFKSYSGFNERLKQHTTVLKKYKGLLEKISGDSFSFKNLMEVGRLMKHFYELYDDSEYNDTFMFSFGFHGYLDNLLGISKNIKDNKMSFAKFINQTKSKSKKHGFKKAYYASLINKPHIKNDICLDKNLSVTGPNASGKTTILKTTLINILLSQQMGCGFYKSANLVPYKHIHCYLNIPDTSGRDSLFQAEARRCKEILDAIHANKKDTHFCVFDELYSGTNPDEAVISALGFMEYLVKFPTVKCLLTTHFIQLCKILGSRKMIENYHMETKKNKAGDDFSYTYLLKKGISEVRGGLKVLQDLSYPEEILRRKE